MKNKGVSAIIGVILMVAIVVAIAATVYVYIELYYEPEADELTVEGTVLSVEILGTSPTLNTTVYNVTLELPCGCEESYSMLFRTEDAVVPPTGVTLRFYYNIVLSDYYDVYKIKSL